MYSYRPNLSQMQAIPGVFTLNRWLYIKDPKMGWIESVGRNVSGILNDLREATAQPFISKMDLKPGFYGKEFVH